MSRLDPRGRSAEDEAVFNTEDWGLSVSAGQIGSLVVFASNPFLGQLLGPLDEATHKRVSASHPVDLTSLPLHELARRLHAEFGL